MPVREYIIVPTVDVVSEIRRVYGVYLDNNRGQTPKVFYIDTDSYYKLLDLTSVIGSPYHSLYHGLRYLNTFFESTVYRVDSSPIPHFAFY